LALQSAGSIAALILTTARRIVTAAPGSQPSEAAGC
jgi:hypothetical protein